MSMALFRHSLNRFESRETLTHGRQAGPRSEYLLMRFFGRGALTESRSSYPPSSATAYRSNRTPEGVPACALSSQHSAPAHATRGPSLSATAKSGSPTISSPASRPHGERSFGGSFFPEHPHPSAFARTSGT